MTSETVNSAPLTVHTAAEASVLLKCNVRWLKDQARRRRIPFSMIGGSYRFSDAHIAEILTIFEQRPEAAPTSKVVRRRTGADVQPAVTTLRARRPQRARRSA